MSTWPRAGLARNAAGVWSSSARYFATWRARSANGVQLDSIRPKPIFAGDADRALGRAGEEDRRMRLLQRVREQLVGAVDVEAEMLAVMGDALAVEEVEQQRQRLLLDVAALLEVDAEAVELVFAVAGAEAEHEAAAAQNVEERRVLGDPQRIGERQGHHRGADLDAFGQSREIAGIDEHVGHDAVFAA